MILLTLLLIILAPLVTLMKTASRVCYNIYKINRTNKSNAYFVYSNKLQVNLLSLSLSFFLHSPTHFLLSSSGHAL